MEVSFFEYTVVFPFLSRRSCSKGMPAAPYNRQCAAARAQRAADAGRGGQGGRRARVHDGQAALERAARPLAAVAVLERQALARALELRVLGRQAQKVLVAQVARLLGLRAGARAWAFM